MAYPSCLELVNLDASCNAISKVGGVASFVYFGSKKSWYDRYVASEQPIIKYDTIDTTNYGWVLEFSPTEILGTELAKFEGVEFKNNAGFETLPGENVNVFNHNVNMILYWNTQAELELLQSILLSEDNFAIVCTNSGDIKVYGLERGKSYSPLGADTFTDKLGLKNISASGGDILEIQGETGTNVSLQAMNILNMPYFLIGVVDTFDEEDYTSYSDMITQLDLLCANN